MKRFTNPTYDTISLVEYLRYIHHKRPNVSGHINTRAGVCRKARGAHPLHAPLHRVCITWRFWDDPPSEVGTKEL